MGILDSIFGPPRDSPKEEPYTGPWCGTCTEFLLWGETCAICVHRGQYKHCYLRNKYVEYRDTCRAWGARSEESLKTGMCGFTGKWLGAYDRACEGHTTHKINADAGSEPGGCPYCGRETKLDGEKRCVGCGARRGEGT